MPAAAARLSVSATASRLVESASHKGNSNNKDENKNQIETPTRETPILGGWPHGGV